MDCSSVTLRIAAFLDDQLGESETEQFAMHIDACGDCAELIVRLERQRFSPLSAEVQQSICGRQEFWGDMEVVLDAHLDQMVLTKTACLGPWHSRRVALPVPMIAAYAAAMVLAVAWGVQQQDRAATAEMASEHLGQQLETERRLAAHPVPPAASSTYKVVTYTPERGTF